MTTPEKRRPCECGCGNLAPLAQYTNRQWGYTKGEPIRFIHGHNTRLRERKGELHVNAMGYRVARPAENGRVHRNGYVLEHIAVVERALGRPLPKGAVIHHVNGDRTDNRPQNLVVCPDQAYHLLLHKRQRAFDACGHADWRKCTYCGEYDDPSRMYLSRTGSQAHHRECRNRMLRAKRQARPITHAHAASSRSSDTVGREATKVLNEA
jgi:hypothetical protein